MILNFRGVRGDKLVYSKDCFDLSMFFSLVDNSKIMMYVGRDDILDQPIFEGDYLYEYHKRTKTKGDKLMLVEWDVKQMGFIFKFYQANMPNQPMASFDYPSRYKHLMIAGNVFHNPELKDKWELK